MGVGKGYALAWMSRKGIFPLEDIVHIDPDHFKQVMPEWQAYLQYGRKHGDPDIPGNRCHRESCYMQEIALEDRAWSMNHFICITLASSALRRAATPATSQLCETLPLRSPCGGRSTSGLMVLCAPRIDIPACLGVDFPAFGSLCTLLE